MRTPIFGILLAIILSGCSVEKTAVSDDNIVEGMENSMKKMLDSWYPLSVDTLHGGFLSSFTYDFKPTDDQRKMIVSQARHLWTNSKAAERYPDVDHYKTSARHGFRFLKDLMWDKQYGGFYWLVERDGIPVKDDTLKTAYGNSFGIFALAAYYKMSKDEDALRLAKDAFLWMEKHSHDKEYGGYFQHLRRNGTPVARPANVPSTSELGYKDQNSSIHLLEAFTELYHVWPDPLVKERLAEMMILIRDTIVTPEGYLTLFLQHDFTPVSFRDSPKEVVAENHYLDHVSFGHDVETAFLLIEAGHALGIDQDSITPVVTKRMIDHALRNGWDNAKGGFYDEAYYYKGDSSITITYNTKNWWAQAEGLNCLLMMSSLYPDDPMEYYSRFVQLWNYANENLIDHEHGDWFAGGTDKQPELRTALKGHIWKATYHQYRAMANCVDRLRDISSQEKFGK
jgi:mannobiose 2-epimerase